MISILLTILKILGIILLVLLGTAVLVILLVLFVPVRYRITVRRKLQEDMPVRVRVRVSWLLHLLHASFEYPQAAYVKARVLGIPVYRSDAPKKEKKEKGSGAEEKKAPAQETGSEDTGKPKQDANPEQEKALAQDTIPEKRETPAQAAPGLPDKAPETSDKQSDEDKEPSIIGFFRRLWKAIKNIGYTIRKIYDKIRHIVKNIRYYVQVLQSDTFRLAFGTCSGEIIKLLKYLRPRKFTGQLVVGMDDPADTGQIMAIWGMLYPLIGEHINITPDFERQILEGDLLITGRITAFRLIKTAWIVYFNKDLRHLIKLLKREELKNGRK